MLLTILKRRQGIIISLLLLVSSTYAPTSVAADKASKLPFIGTRSFSFYDESEAGNIITIKQSGATRIEFVGVSDSHVEYEGPFRNPIKLPDGSGYLFKKGKVILLNNQGKPQKDCMGDGSVCRSELLPQ